MKLKRNPIDFIGRKFHNGTIIEYIGAEKGKYIFARNYTLIFKMRCDCGKEYNARYYASKICVKSCGCIPNKPSKCLYGEIILSSWTKLVYEAKQRNLEFSISPEYIWNIFLQQERKCRFSGLELILAKSNKERESGCATASLDRIDSSKGYIEGNVQWIHKDLNFMKSNMSDKEFINWCSLVTDNIRKQ
jgi:hypothetical protein